jgi:hypothetical protein
VFSGSGCCRRGCERRIRRPARLRKSKVLKERRRRNSPRPAAVYRCRIDNVVLMVDVLANSVVVVVVIGVVLFFSLPPHFLLPPPLPTLLHGRTAVIPTSFSSAGARPGRRTRSVPFSRFLARRSRFSPPFRTASSPVCSSCSTSAHA